MPYIHKNTDIKFKYGKIHSYNNYDISRTSCGKLISDKAIDVKMEIYKHGLNLNDYCAKCFNL